MNVTNGTDQCGSSTIQLTKRPVEVDGEGMHISETRPSVPRNIRGAFKLTDGWYHMLTPQFADTRNAAEAERSISSTTALGFLQPSTNAPTDILHAKEAGDYRQHVGRYVHRLHSKQRLAPADTTTTAF